VKPEATNDYRVLQLIVAALGLINLATGASLLLAPVWFYATIAGYAPYNRHFIGDAGAFVLALGLGLLLAARSLARQRLLVAMAALASGLHTANHFIDDVLSPQALPAYWATNTLPLLVMTLLLVYVTVRLWQRGGPTAGPA
jgi:uncharacterized membrane protein